MHQQLATQLDGERAELALVGRRIDRDVERAKEPPIAGMPAQVPQRRAHREQGRIRELDLQRARPLSRSPSARTARSTSSSTRVRKVRVCAVTVGSSIRANSNNRSTKAAGSASLWLVSGEL